MVPNSRIQKMFKPLSSLFVALIIFLAGDANAQDYAREKRWHDEILPTLVVGEATYISAKSGEKFLGLYATVPNSKTALLIVHGIGVHPDHGVIGALRVSLADAGYTTLSIQMPVLEKDKMANDYYPALFPDALDRIDKAALFLKSKGADRIVLISHSLGSWMSNVYLDQTTSPPIAAWVCMGLTGGFQSRVLGMNLPRLSVKLPIFDVYGEKDLPPSLAAAARRATAIADLAHSRQVRIDGADHFYAGKEAALSMAIQSWIKSLPAL
jgi:pimeloyl-ACP methyl ester carboxylesterase